MFKDKYYWYLLIVPVIFVIFYVYKKSENKPIRTLPYFGPKKKAANADSLHTVFVSTFTDQFGEKVDKSTVDGKVFVTDFFFTNCQSICPIMSNSLEKVYAAFKNRSDFLILSHTVDPERDSIVQLRAYAKLHGVNDHKWLFLTGGKRELYRAARKSYLLSNDEGNGDADDFVHTQNFALVDKDKHIRGFYDGTDSLEIQRLILDLKTLFQDYESRH